MSTALEIYTGGPAPRDASQNTAFHAELIGLLVDGARGEGWQGAEICSYDRHQGGVSIGIRAGDGTANGGRAWPTLDDLRAYREAHRNDPPLRPPVSDEEQGNLL